MPVFLHSQTLLPADDDRTGTNNKYFFNVFYFLALFISSHHIHKSVKQVTGILWSRACLRMELYGENVFPTYAIPSFVPSLTLTNAGFAIFSDPRVSGIYHIAMILGRNVNTVCCKSFNRMVSSAVSIFHLMGVSACCKCHQLMSKQIAKIGVSDSYSFLISLIISVHSFGSPGPLLNMIPSGFVLKDFFCGCVSRINGHFTATII